MFTSDAAWAVVVVFEVPEVLGVGVPDMIQRLQRAKRAAERRNGERSEPWRGLAIEASRRKL